jgi:glycerol-3-phosphate acyltransferase PlsY
MIVLLFVGAVVLGYLIGSIPVGVIVGRMSRGIDVRDYGSGGMGMTNVIRTLGAKAGAIVFAADVLKGAVAAGVAWGLFTLSPGMFAWGLMVFVGFRGGRGVNTAFGALLVISWLVAVICLPLFILVVALTRYVSLGSILAGLAMVLVMIVFFIFDMEPLAYVIFGAVVATLVIFRHRGNIQRLLTGTERKIGQRTEIP